MLIEKLRLTERDKRVYYETILNNPYIPLKPYPKQSLPIILAGRPERLVDGVKKPNSVLAGAGGFGGKSVVGAILAAQYLQAPDYTCLVTRRNYAELLDTNSIWENLTDWVTRDELGPLKCKVVKSPSPQITAPNGNTIYFKAFNEEKMKQKLKSASYDRIINDEASELPEGILPFQYRSARNTSNIPRSIINLSNPGGPSTDYLVERFVDGSYPYVSLDWRDNPHIDREAYEGSLDELDYIDQQYQKYGNWKYKPQSGDLIDRETLEKARIAYDDYKDYVVAYNVLGVDLAGKGHDRTVVAGLTLLQNGRMVVTRLDSDVSPYPEHMVYDSVYYEYEDFMTNMVNIELEPGSDSLYSLRYWQGVLEDVTVPYGVVVTGTHASASKYNRARPVAFEVAKGNLFFDERLDLDALFEQFLYVHPSPEVMKKEKSPDELDALGYAYMKVREMKNGGCVVR